MCFSEGALGLRRLQINVSGLLRLFYGQLG